MKQLKFMLAAATAIGLASAAQAGYLSGSTDFETGTVESLFTYNGEPAVQDGDNESEIADGAAVGVAVGNNNFTGDKAKKLKVNTGTTPILRSVDGTEAGASLANGNIYIDTLVKFTVTPDGDTPKATAEDKLLIYLKEDLSDSGNPVTNLVARAAAFDDEDGMIEDDNGKGKEFVLNTNIDGGVLPNTWYRLVVMAVGDITGENDGVNYFPGFQIYLGGAEEKYLCTLDETPGGSGAWQDNYLLSLAADVAGTAVGNATISSVGFAGEGEVDDLVISTFDPAKTVVDFTLALDDTVGGISGKVTYSCNAQSGELSGSVSVSCYTGDTVTVSYSLKSETEYSASWTGATVANNAFEVTGDTAGDTITLVISKNAPSAVDFTLALGTGVSAVTWTIDGVAQTDTLTGKVTDGQRIAITGVTYADWYGPTGTYVKDWSGVWGTDVTADITVEAKKLAEVANDGSGSVVIESTTTPAELNIMTGSFASEAAGSEELTKAVKWATSKGGATASTVGSTVGALNFADSEETQAEKAYLLNVADNAEAVADAIAAFKFDAFDPLDPPEADDFASKGYNGTVTIKGATAVDGVWGNADATSKFFKAVLTK